MNHLWHKWSNHINRQGFIALLTIVAVIVFTESTIMFAIDYLMPNTNNLLVIALDSGVMMIVSFCLVYFLVFLPMNKNIMALKTLKQQLENAKDSLESQVATRTGILQNANEELEDEIALRRSFEQSLYSVAERLSQKTGESLFDSLIEFLCSEVNGDYALLGKYLKGSNKIITITAYAEKRKIENFEYDLRGTPCEIVMGKESCFIPTGVQDLFPQDQLLADMGVQGYVGIPLLSFWKEPIGIIVVLSKSPMDKSKNQKIQSLMKILSVRVEAELEHQRLYHEIAGSEKRYRELAELLPCYVFELAPDGRLMYANRNALDSLGYDFNKNIFLTDLVSPDQQEHFLLDIDRWLQSHDAMFSKYIFRKSSGEMIPSAVYAKSFSDVSGNVTGIRIAAMDISAIEAASIALSQSEEKYRTVFESTGSAMMMVDRDFRVIMSNGRLASLLNLTIESGASLDCRTVFSPELCIALTDVINGTQPSPMNLSTVIDAKGRGHLNVSANLVLMPERNNVLISLHDMTELYRYQEETLRAAHMASIGELAAGVAHEINNPINIILLEAQLIENTLSHSSKDSETHKSISQIIRECNRITSIVKSLLSFARKDDEERTSTDLGQLVSEAVSITGHLFRKSSIAVDVSIDADTPEVKVNPKQIVQIMLNVLMNAQYALNSKHQQPHPDKRIEIRTEDYGEYVRVIFTDYGIGMSKDIMRSAVTPFFTTKPRHMGTGLGLSISHSLVSQNGGTMHLESQEGKYTKVILDLPKAERHET